MHALARHGVPGKQWRIQHAVKHEVTDWTIIDEGKLAEALAIKPKYPLLQDMDAVEIHRCVRLADEAGTEYTEHLPEGDTLPEDATPIGQPFFTVFGHYRAGGGKQGLDTLCDCPTQAHAGMIASLLEEAIRQAR